MGYPLQNALKALVLLIVLSIYGQGMARNLVDYRVVPLPMSIQTDTTKTFTLQSSMGIAFDDSQPELRRNAEFLCQWVEQQTGVRLQLTPADKKAAIRLTLGLSAEKEAYAIIINKKGVTIQAPEAVGIFRAIQTLRKSLPVGQYADGIQLPFATINDAPRFSYRGVHLDCARHFFGVDVIKRYLDLLALHGCNQLHWHITDDQGWRTEIKKWPKLMEVGSHRTGTIIGTNSDIDDQIPYGGYYTQAEAREIVAYAAARHITVVPEIDMPGHMLAALASYPELGCTGGPYQVGHYWGVYKDVLCVGNPKVYQFVEDVLTEIMDIFPSEVIHIGGDETPTEKWEACPKCQGIKEKQAHFTKRVFDFLTSKGRRALGWDEILDGSPQDAMIMSWRGTAPGAKAAEAGHDVIMAPTTHCYLDYQQVEDVLFEPSRCGGFIPIEKVYSLDPAPDSLSVEARQHILGTQANLWSEYMTNEAMVEYQALPRMTALAEVQWTMPERKNFDDFKQRLGEFTKYLEYLHYTYCKHLWPERQIPNRWQF